MFIQMICSDLDGTLIPYGQKGFDPQLFDLIRALAAKGIVFCPASGRQYTSLRALFAPVAEHCAFLCENGGVLYKDEACIGKTPMPRPLAEAIARDFWARSEGQGEVMLSGQNCAYLMERGLGMLERIRFIGNRYQLIRDPADVPEDIVKVSVYLHEGVDAYVDRFVPRWQQANCAVAGPYWIDTTLANKGTGVQALCRALGIDPRRRDGLWRQLQRHRHAGPGGAPYIMDTAAAPLRARYPNHTPRPEDVLRALLQTL